MKSVGSYHFIMTLENFNQPTAPPHNEGPRPKPVLWRGAVTTLIAALVGIAAVFGFDLPDGATEAVVILLVSLSGLVTAMWSTNSVTPMSSPMGYDGLPMISFTDAGLMSTEIDGAHSDRESEYGDAREAWSYDPFVPGDDESSDELTTDEMDDEDDANIPLAKE